MADGFQKIVESIQNPTYGNHANKLAVVDRMVEVSTSSPPQPDSYFRDCQKRIDQMENSHDRHEAYELLLAYIANNHPYGYASPIYDEINELANRNSR